MNARNQSQGAPEEQLPLFAGAVCGIPPEPGPDPDALSSAVSARVSGEIRTDSSAESVAVRNTFASRYSINPHLRAARRLARKMRKLPDHSAEQTQAGLAICQQLKAFLRDGVADSDSDSLKPH